MILFCLYSSNGREMTIGPLGDLGMFFESQFRLKAHTQAPDIGFDIEDYQERNGEWYLDEYCLNQW